MADNPTPGQAGQASRSQQARESRLKVALKANMARRKAQARARMRAEGTTEASGCGDETAAPGRDRQNKDA